MQDRRTIDEFKELFRRWYEVPLKTLLGIENGDGGFVALSVALFLYDRFVQTQHSKEVGINEISEDLSNRLGISEQDANTTVVGMLKWPSCDIEAGAKEGQRHGCHGVDRGTGWLGGADRPALRAVGSKRARQNVSARLAESRGTLRVPEEQLATGRNAR